MELQTLQSIWFILVTVLLTGYAILDGFDLGVGILHPFAKTEEDRRININSVGPMWDGNEVWLIAGGGALFAAFSPVYAAVWSGFYIALMLLLAALIGRAIAFDFRRKMETDRGKAFFDWTFAVGSLLIAILLGVALGNIMRGIPIDQEGWYRGGFFDLLNPYSILIGILTALLFTMHGAIYMTMKTDGVRRENFFAVSQKVWIPVVILYVVVSFMTFFEADHLFEYYFPAVQKPIWYVSLLIVMLCMVGIPLMLAMRKAGLAFIASSLMILGMMGTVAVGLFPRLVPSSTNPAFDLTAFAHSNSAYTLEIMLYIALAGMPLALVYKFILYRAFRGKTVLTKESY